MWDGPFKQSNKDGAWSFLSNKISQKMDETVKKDLNERGNRAKSADIDAMIRYDGTKRNSELRVLWAATCREN